MKEGYRLTGKPRAQRVIRTNVQTGKDNPPFDDVDCAADAAPCSPTTMRVWIKDRKEHYGYTYRYETLEERAGA